MSPSRKILIIDDNKDIHADFRKIFASVGTAAASLNALESDLFGSAAAKQTPRSALSGITLDSAYQGEEGIQLVKNAAAAGEMYLLAFVDVRMPPGIDGIQTIIKIWQIAVDLPCVICT